MDNKATSDALMSIAIIGMAGRFPGAKTLEEFWQNLQSGVESSAFFSEEELLAAGVTPAILQQPNYVKAGRVLADVDCFDASFFDVTNREAALMDPQQRFFLEVAWEALEVAGYAAADHDSKVGVYAGASANSYLLPDLTSYFEPTAGTDMFQALLGNDKDYLATRFSYKLNLNGPSITVQTACSTSLVAICQACQSLLNYQCDMALAGGVSIRLPMTAGYLAERGSIFSPDGHCYPFDARACGTVFGSGVGVVVLKRLAEAIADGDYIQAVIKGSAVNNDGALKVGYTAPGLDGQADVIAMALAQADVEPETITYVETHGTGTAIGDPIEVAALTKAFSPPTTLQHCALGSVKANVGHLEAAAGVTSLIKTVLALQNKQLPPTPTFTSPNPQIDFIKSPFYVNRELTDWSNDHGPLRAGVSSFGIGGTNAHVILEEAPQNIIRGGAQSSFPSVSQGSSGEPTTQTAKLERPFHVLCLSTQTALGLKTLAQRFQTFLENSPTASLANVCFTANSGRRHFEHRLAVFANSTTQLRKQLSDFMRDRPLTQGSSNASDDVNPPPLAFLFTGQGAQSIEMGRELYATQPTFRASLNRCNQILEAYLEQSLLSVLYPDTGQSSPLSQTAYTQPALFALEYSLAQLLKSWGITPSVVMGHSAGEYVAACIAGVFSLEDGLRLIAERGRLMQELPQTGTMAAVFASEAQVLKTIHPYAQDVVIASINNSQNVVISGRKRTLDQALEAFQAQDIEFRLLDVSHAFHSPLMESMLAAFEQVANTVDYALPSIDIISNVTGALITDEIATPDYWCKHIQKPVRFSTSMESLHQQGYRVFLEVGPKPTLLGMGHQCLPADYGIWLPTLRSGHADWQILLQSLTGLYTQGVAVNWAGFDKDYARARLPLPTYPWQHKSHWLTKRITSTSTPIPDAATLWQIAVEAGQSQAQQGPLDLALQTYPAKQAAMERLMIAYIIQALTDLGAYQQPNECYAINDLMVRFKVAPTHRKLLTLWLKKLVSLELLSQPERNRFKSERPLPDPHIETCLSDINTLFADVPFLIDYLQRCGKDLAKVLTGTQSPLETLFPGGSFETAEHLYGQWAVSRYFNHIIGSIIRAVVNALPLGRKLRILEIGAGTGGTTATVLPVIPANRAQYYFTDISDFFFVRAREKLKAYPSLRYELLDIERDPKVFGYADQSFDIIIATNVLHATRDLEKTMAHVKKLLAPGGFLLLNELTRHTTWLEISMGLLEGWQKFDDAWRKDNPLLSEHHWHDLLQKHQFEQIIAFPEQDSPAKILDQHVLVAQASGTLSRQAALDSGIASLAALTPAPTSGNNTLEQRPQLTTQQLLEVSPKQRQLQVETYLLQQIAQALGVTTSEINPDQGMQTMGLDSLMTVVLRNRIETDLSLTMPAAHLAPEITLTQLTQKILAQLLSATTTTLTAPELTQRPRPQDSLTVIQSKGTQPPFIFVHPGGLEATKYAKLAQQLGADQPFYVLHPPGLNSYQSLTPEHASLTSIETLAAQSLASLATIKNEGPYRLGGWSLGGCIAFEMAQQIKQQKQQSVELLALFDVTNIVSSPLNDDESLVPGFASYLGIRQNQVLQLGFHELKDQDLERQLHSVLKHAIKDRVLPANTRLAEIYDFFQMYKNGTQSSLKRVQNYHPQPYRNQIVLFQANEVLDGLSEVNHDPIKSWQRWCQFVAQPPEVQTVPGNHYTMLVEPNIQILGQKLKECLRKSV